MSSRVSSPALPLRSQSASQKVFEVLHSKDEAAKMRVQQRLINDRQEELEQLAASKSIGIVDYMHAQHALSMAGAAFGHYFERHQ